MITQRSPEESKASNYRKVVLGIAVIILVAALVGHAPAAEEPIVDSEWGQFLKDKVSFNGFVENPTGLSISHGSRFFNTSNRFIMNRTTFQPEFDVEAADWAKFFISWRFVKEPRYNAEASSGGQSETGAAAPQYLLRRIQPQTVGGGSRSQTVRQPEN